ncbi:hypothetical protein T484DRAFT_1840450, partial [Baffinella frigidus]
MGEGGGAGGSAIVRLRSGGVRVGCVARGGCQVFSIEMDAVEILRTIHPDLSATVEGTLSRLEIEDTSMPAAAAVYPKIFTAESGASLVKVAATWDCPSCLNASPDVSRDIRIQINKPQITLLVRFIFELFEYAASFSPPKPPPSPGAALAALDAPPSAPTPPAPDGGGEHAPPPGGEGAAPPQAAQRPGEGADVGGAEGGRRVMISVELHHPVVVIPRSSMSEEGFLADLGLIKVSNPRVGVWSVDLQAMRIDTVAEGGTKSKFVWDVDGVAEITWPRGVRVVNIMLQEVRGSMTDAQMGLLLSVLAENVTETRIRTGPFAPKAGPSNLPEAGPSSLPEAGLSSLNATPDAGLSAASGPEAGSSSVSGSEAGLPANPAALGSGASGGGFPPEEQAQGGGSGNGSNVNGVAGLKRLWELVARASAISREASGSKSGTGIRVRYAFSARKASLALGVAGWQGLAAGPAGVKPLVSAKVSGLDGFWEGCDTPGGLLWRCEIGVAAVQKARQVVDARPEMSGRVLPFVVDARPEMSGRVLPFVAADPPQDETDGLCSLFVGVERTEEMHFGVQVSLGGAEAVGDAGLFLKLLTFFGDANRHCPLPVRVVLPDAKVHLVRSFVDPEAGGFVLQGKLQVSYASQGDGAEVIAEADGVELISRRRIGGDVSGSMPASPASPGKMARRRSSVDGGEDDEDAFEDPGWEDSMVMNPSSLSVQYAWRLPRPPTAAPAGTAAEEEEELVPEVSVRAADFEATLTHADVLLIDEVRAVLTDSLRSPSPSPAASLAPSTGRRELQRPEDTGADGTLRGPPSSEEEEEGGLRGPPSALQEPPSPVASGARGLVLAVNIGSLTVVLPGGGAGGALAARVSAQRFAVNVKWGKGGGCEADGNLGHPSLFTVHDQSDSLVAFRARYPPAGRLAGTPMGDGEGNEIKIFVNRPRITVLLSWIADLRAYLASFGPASGTSSEGGEDGRSKSASKATKIAIELQHPVVVVPRSSVSGEAFVADLGLIEMQNVSSGGWTVALHSMRLDTVAE